MILIRPILVMALVAIVVTFPLDGYSATAKWKSLLEGDPFTPFKPPEPPPPPKPSTLEFRGLSVEQGVKYFSFFDKETKKSFWLKDSEARNGMRVRSYDPEHALILTDNTGREVRFGLQASAATAVGGPPRSNRVNSLLAATPPAAKARVAAVAPGAAESRRLEQLAEQVRERRTARLAQAGTKS